MRYAIQFFTVIVFCCSLQAEDAERSKEVSEAIHMPMQLFYMANKRWPISAKEFFDYSEKIHSKFPRSYYHDLRFTPDEYGQLSFTYRVYKPEYHEFVGCVNLPARSSYPDPVFEPKK